MAIDPEKGIHWPTMITAVSSIIVWAIFVQLIVPNLPFFVRSYFPHIADEDVGYYAGYMISLFYLGQIPGSFFWGWFADHYGRKTAMLLIISGNTLCIFGLGFSKNYYLSLLFRFIHGVIDGSLGVCKTIMADLSNDRNIAIGTGFLFVGSTIGGVIGPILGGYLSDANNIKPLVKRFPFLRDMPYLVPISICAILHLIVLVMFIFMAEETLSKKDIEKNRKLKEKKDSELSQALLKGSNSSIASQTVLRQIQENSSYWSVFKNRDLLLSVSIYGLLSFSQMSFDTIIPLLFFNKREYGGFELDAVGESWLSTFSTSLQVFCLLLTPVWSRLMSYRSVVIWATVGFAITVFFAPVASLFNHTSEITQFAVIFVVSCINIPFRTVVFNLSIVLISNSTYKEFRATALGLGQVASGVFRFIGPSLVPMLFAWSTSYNKFPIDYGFSFYVIGIFLFLTAAFPLLLSKEIETGKGSVYTAAIHKEQSVIDLIESDGEAIKI